MDLTLVKSESFNGVTCDFYQGGNDIWMTREQIGRSLEYDNPEDAIYRIHKRHKDRLDRFSVIDKVSSTDGKMYETYLYSAKGVYEICRWSRQPKAHEFMDFVWDVMESLRTGRFFDDNQVARYFKRVNDRLAAIEARLDAVLPSLPARPGLQLVLPPGAQKRRVLYTHSKIGDLPADLRAKVHSMLDSGHTYAQIAEFLRRAGINVSKSAVGRYAQKYFTQERGHFFNCTRSDYS